MTFFHITLIEIEIYSVRMFAYTWKLDAKGSVIRAKEVSLNELYAIKTVKTKTMNRIYFRKILPNWLFNILKNIDSNMQRIIWIQRGKPLPAIHPVKQDVVKLYKKRTGYNVLIETGTYTGEMIYVQRNNFDQIHSVELSDHYYKLAIERFKEKSHINIWHGNSSDILPVILDKLNSSAIFWLDGHYSGGLTAGKEKNQMQTPILAELDAIFAHKEKHLILIDDARNFVGEDDYPTIEELKKYLNDKKRRYTFEVSVDIIRIEIIDPILNIYNSIQAPRRARHT